MIIILSKLISKINGIWNKGNNASQTINEQDRIKNIHTTEHGKGKRDRIDIEIANTRSDKHGDLVKLQKHPPIRMR